MGIFEQTSDEKINFRVRQIEMVLGFVKTHIASGDKEKAAKEAQNLKEEIWKLEDLLKS